MGTSSDGSHSHHFAGEIAELLIYDHPLPPEDRDAVLDYLDRKYFQYRGGLLLRVR